MAVDIRHGDCLEVLGELPGQHFHCVVTSPPYWCLRDYGTGTWEGGDAECDHKPPVRQGANGQRANRTNISEQNKPYQLQCRKCGARRVDQQIGLEPTPADYIAKMVDVFRGVWRVLRDDGTLWLNIGDSYNQDSTWGGSSSNKNALKQGYARKQARERESACKPKDLVGIPWQLAIALRDDGWYLRSEIIWHKKSPMPESVRDRPTKAHEQIFLLTKQPRYFYDNIGSAEDAVGGTPGNVTHKGATAYQNGDKKHRTKAGLVNVEAVSTRNMRSVSHGAPHAAQQPFSLVPARRHLRTNALGYVAKWASEHGSVESVQRVTETVRVKTRPGTDTKLALAGGNRDPYRHVSTTVTTGWQPGCACHSDTVPCRVLDPFGGAGTTALAAKQLGRDCTLIELNQDYIEIIESRLRKPLESPPVKQPPSSPGQMELFP